MITHPGIHEFNQSDNTVSGMVNETRKRISKNRNTLRIMKITRDEDIPGVTSQKNHFFIRKKRGMDLYPLGVPDAAAQEIVGEFNSGSTAWKIVESSKSVERSAVERMEY